MNTFAHLFVWSGTRPRPSIPRITPAALGCEYEDIQFVSAFEDAVTLSGWLIKSKTPAIGSIVLCHGHTSTRSEMLKRAVLLSRHHFTTLLFDFRARGLSRGDRCTLGHCESWDVVGAVNCLTERADTRPNPICIVGNSMGGAAAILAASRDKRICAVVAEGTFANLRNVVTKRASFAVGPFASRVAGQCAELGISLANLNIDSISPAGAIAAISPRPILLITDGLDAYLPSQQNSGRSLQFRFGPKTALDRADGAALCGIPCLSRSLRADNERVSNKRSVERRISSNLNRKTTACSSTRYATRPFRVGSGK